MFHPEHEHFDNPGPLAFGGGDDIDCGVRNGTLGGFPSSGFSGVVMKMKDAELIKTVFGWKPVLALAPALSLAAALALTACAQTADIMPAAASGSKDGGVAAAKPSFNQFPDLPVPANTKIVIDKTLVFGTKPWFGQLALTSFNGANAVFDFYRANLTGYGWQEITSVRAPTSILTYTREDRVLAIAIQSATIRGSDVTITVSPRGNSGGSSGASGNPQTLPPPPVQRLNLNQ